MNKLIVVALVLLVLNAYAADTKLNCYTCGATDSCKDPFKDNGKDIGPTACTDAKMRCIKYKVGDNTYRGCSTADEKTCTP